MDSTHCSYASVWVYVTGVSSLTVLWVFFFVRSLSICIFLLLWMFFLSLAFVMSLSHFRFSTVFFSLSQQILSNPIPTQMWKKYHDFFRFHHYFYFALCYYTGFIFLSRLFNINNSISNHDMFKFSWFWYEILQNIYVFFQLRIFYACAFIRIGTHIADNICGMK